MFSFHGYTFMRELKSPPAFSCRIPTDFSADGVHKYPLGIFSLSPWSPVFLKHLSSVLTIISPSSQEKKVAVTAATRQSEIPHKLLLVAAEFSPFPSPALPPHGEPGMLPGFPALPVCPVRAGVHGVRAGDAALPPPVPASPQRVLQAHGDVRGLLAGGYGVHQVRKSLFFFFFFPG